MRGSLGWTKPDGGGTLILCLQEIAKVWAVEMNVGEVRTVDGVRNKERKEKCAIQQSRGEQTEENIPRRCGHIGKLEAVHECWKYIFLSWFPLFLCHLHSFLHLLFPPSSPPCSPTSTISLFYLPSSSSRLPSSLIPS